MVLYGSMCVVVVAYKSVAVCTNMKSVIKTLSCNGGQKPRQVEANNFIEKLKIKGNLNVPTERFEPTASYL